MQDIIEFLRTDTFFMFLMIIIILLIVLYISNAIKLSKLRKSYKQFMKKLGNGKDIDIMLEKYMDTVNKVEEKNNELEAYCKKIDKDMGKCLQKIGIVRYSAFKDTGSDLSFALAILDEDNNGVVLNGIYSREMSNIYAKPIENGKSTNTLSEEEKQAINKAISI